MADDATRPYRTSHNGFERSLDTTLDVIRLAGPRDRQGVVDLWHACGLISDELDPQRDFDVTLGEAAAVVLVAVTPENNVIGSGLVEHDGDQGYLWYVAVAPTRRNEGVGRLIIEACERWLKRNDIGVAQLSLKSDDRGVLKFYQKIGYQMTGPALMRRNLKVLCP